MVVLQRFKRDAMAREVSRWRQQLAFCSIVSTMSCRSCAVRQRWECYVRAGTEEQRCQQHGNRTSQRLMSCCGSLQADVERSRCEEMKQLSCCSTYSAVVGGWREDGGGGCEKLKARRLRYSDLSTDVFGHAGSEICQAKWTRTGDAWFRPQQYTLPSRCKRN